jgi:hypothetical protein
MTLSRLASVVGSASIVGAVLLGGSGAAVAESDPLIVITTPGERSTANLATTAGLAGAGVLVGALGLYFHLDSRSLSDEVSAKVFTGDIWTQDKADKVTEAADDRTGATVSYTVGGALLASALVYYILTEPEDEKVLIHTKPTPLIVPQQGGAFLGGEWSF